MIALLEEAGMVLLFIFKFLARRCFIHYLQPINLSFITVATEPTLYLRPITSFFFRAGGLCIHLLGVKELNRVRN